MNSALALLGGLVAGLAIAIPLGAIAVLLLQEGMHRGFRRGLPAAAGVASVDVLYCLAAALLGSVAAPAVRSLAPWPAVVGGIALVAIAVWSVLRRASPGTSEPGSIATQPATGWMRFSLFFGLTLINPATLVYFAALMTGLDGIAGDAWAAVCFIAGVGVGSFVWQAALVAVGGILHGRIGPRARRITTVIGSLVVAALGVGLVVTALL
ncbi:threonine/homoserine/homoserine lactone efflux protein [Microbacteriaceae bacterium SG_E_30_P1]|uniref:Threonine/homoserine/homoserine lactone efflux protein n=1 Tax=Antiquaquibacter oligotrophicus TaxID=2880260 RepID=A0ABT6KLM3_9MICO|nr:LysE family transporter [Antiquaquibacter oligotrophicus]MDH6180012.1 threonine/homoserine/homoserine lactone efflux protein [Antiquaquibacter oligotrophicus]UDF14233.1 LysE family transporter [Antiquaquibacter oligotrophicus]